MIFCSDVWKSYGSLQVLKGLTLTCPEGKTTIILGRSGVGKSVLLRQILGLERPDLGYIEVSGFRISQAKEKDLYFAMKNFGMLFQSSALFDSMPIGQNVAFYLAHHGDPETKKKLPQSVIDDMVSEALKKVGLEGYQQKMPSQLSGGQKRRAALARLIIYKPKIVLYDEPTTGLDPITAMQINELILQTHNELGATTVVVTHDIHSALEIGDYFALHHEGKIAYVEEKDTFVQIPDPLVRDFFDDAIIPSKYMKLLGK
jgi:phospholipid/cholesterol/gamma-HCH transport system ATP-binding protein